MTAKSITRSVPKIALVALTAAIGGLTGLIAAALAYREWVPARPCPDILPQFVGLCAVPTAPAWLLVIGVAIGAAFPLLALRFAPLLPGRRAQSSPI